MASPGQAIAEYFTLRRARALEGRIGDGVRKPLADALALGRQRAEAAEVLWSSGHLAEGLRLALEALDTTDGAIALHDRLERAAQGGPAVEGSEEAAGEPGAQVRARVLGARLAAKRIARIEEAIAAAAALQRPALDADVSPACSDLYQRVIDAQRAIDRVLAPAAMSKRELWLSSAFRIGLALLLLAATVTALWLVLRPEKIVRATASATWLNSPTLSPDKAVDELEDTWWILPDRATGWLQVRMDPPRDISVVRLLNTANRPHYDRGTKDYTLEIWAGGRLARSVNGSFAFAREPRWVNVPVNVDGVDKIRFVVRSYHHLGGGLSELSWEE